MVLVGHDRFVIRCLRYMSAQMLPMLLSISWSKVLHMRFTFATSPGFSEVPKLERQALGRLRYGQGRQWLARDLCLRSHSAESSIDGGVRSNVSLLNLNH